MSRQQQQMQPWYIPFKPTKRLNPWKQGEEKACARGINERKHRETAEYLQWQARRGNKLPLEGRPSDQPIYAVAMDAIRVHQGQVMEVVVAQTEESDLVSFGQRNPAEMYTLQFICEELVEKQWDSSKVQFQPLSTGGGFIVLVSDFRV
jgi:hypothetical protein